MQNLTGKYVFFSKENFMLLIVFQSSGIWTSSSSKMPLLHFQRSQEEYDMKSNSSDWICNILATYLWTLQQASRVGTVSVILHTRNRLESWRFSRSGGGCSSALVDGWEAECFNGVGGGRRACCCAQSVRRCVLNIKKTKREALGNRQHDFSSSGTAQSKQPQPAFTHCKVIWQQSQRLQFCFSRTDYVSQLQKHDFNDFPPFCRIYLFKDAQSRLAALILHRVTGVLNMHRRQRWWSIAAVHELEAALRLLLDGRRTTKRNDGRRNHQPSDFFPSSADCLLASSADTWPTLQSPGHSAVPPIPRLLDPQPTHSH